MKKLLITFLVLISLYASAQKTYYVSASGNDTNDGSQGSPIKTINKAISLAVPGDRILLNGGDAFYGGVIPKSGTINAPITFGSYGIGKAIITGFSDVTGWSQVGNIWTSAISVSSVNMVIINGSFAPIGKWPNGNKVYNTITSSTSNSVTSSTITGNWTGGQLVIRKNHWIIDKGPVTAQSGSTVTYTPPNTTYNPQPGWGFFIQNHQSACDQQNEWFFSGGKLGIYSASQPANVKACTTDNLVQVNANAYINFFGLQFVGSNAAAVTITSGHDIIFESCDFLFQGINGFNVQSSAHHIKVNNCTSNWTNNNFINAGGSTDWIITNNLFQNTATIAGMGNSSDGNYIGIYNIGANSLVQSNKLINTGYIGIDFRGPAIAVNKNIIDTFCTVKDDGGGIYTYTGTSAVVYSQRFVTNNIVQNGGGASAGTNTTNSDAFGIYMDGNASEVTIDSNYIQNCGSSGIFLHGNHNLTVTNNTVYNAVVTGGYGQLLVITDPSFAAPMRNVVVTGNKFVSKTASQVAGYFKGGLNDYNQWGRFDSNYYSGNKFFAGSATNFGGWQTTSGMEKQSSVGPAQTTPPVPSQPPQVFTNVAQSKTFIKNNCTTGTGSSIVYTVPAGKYTSTVSQADADAKATDDINANGQAYANTNGTCSAPPPVIYYNAQYSKIFAKNNCGSGYSGSSVIYTVPASKYSSTISQADADSKATGDVNTNGQNYANSKGICTKLNCSFWDKVFGRKGCHF